MPGHADPLVQRIIATQPPEPEPSALAVPDWRDTRDREIEQERGLSLAHLDLLVRERCWDVRNEERLRAMSSIARARMEGRTEGFARGVATAVTELRRDPDALLRDVPLDEQDELLWQSTDQDAA